MRGKLIYLIVILNFILQTTLFQGFRINGIIPNTSLILIVVISIFYGHEKGIVSGIVAGLLQDFFFSKAIGINLLIYTIIAYFIGGLKKKLFKDNFLTPILLIFISTIFYNFAYFVIMYFLRESFNFFFIIKKIILLESLLNMTVGLLIYKIFYQYYYSNRYK